MRTSIYLLTAALLLLPVAVWAEHTYPGFWQQRIFARSFGYEPGRQELIHESGTILPTTISEDLTLTAADNPVILKDSVTIESDARLVIEGGTNIYTHEFSHILINGALDITGTADNVVNVYSNHKHPSKNIWNGFIFYPQSQGSIQHAVIRHGSPAIACLKDSMVVIDNTRMHMGEAGVFTSSPNCVLRNSIIHGVRDGIVTTLPDYTFTNSVVTGTRKDVLVGK